MADNPFDRFDAPSGNSFDQFDAPRPSAVAGSIDQSILDRFGRGVLDPVVAAAQMQAHTVPDGLVVKPEERSPMTDMMAMSLGGMPPTMPAKDFDKGLAADETKYQADRAASGSTGTDWWRTGGNVVSTLPVSLIGGVPASMGQAMRGGMVLGAAGSALSPVNTTDQDFATAKAKQAGIGALGGAVTGPLAFGVSRLIQPETSDAVRILMDKGVRPTPGQLIGGKAAQLEDKLTVVPGVGDAIRLGQGRAIDQFNRAVYQDALTPIGETSTAALGRDGVAEVSQKLGQAYDKLLPQLTFKADPQFVGEVSNLASMGANLPKQQAARLGDIVETHIAKKLGPQGTMDGTTFKGVESELNRLATLYSKSPSADDKLLGSAIGEVMSSAKGALERANPALAPELSKINQGYAAYTRIRNAASRLGANGGDEMGVFTPAQYQGAVRALDQSVGKGNFARGRAYGQDMSDAGVSVLGGKYPDSGTSGRGLAALALGSIMSGGAPLAGVNPAAALGVGAGLLSYTKPGQSLLAHLLAGNRYEPVTAPLAAAVRAAGVPAGGAAGGLLAALSQ